MGKEAEDYFAPTITEHTLDSGGNYVSPASSDDDGYGSSGTLSTSIIE